MSALRHLDEVVERGIFYRHGMLAARIAARHHVGLEFLESYDALGLDLLQLITEVAVYLAMTRLLVLTVAAPVFGEGILRIGISSCAHAEHDKRRVLSQELRHPIGYDLQLGSEYADLFQLLRMTPKLEGLVGGLADGTPAGP